MYHKLEFHKYDSLYWLDFSKEKLSQDELSIWERAAFQFLSDWFSDSIYITVQTSGSTGKPKQLQVSKEMMRVSAQKTLNYLQLKPQDTALLCLSADYIAGKMMIVRAIIGELQLYVVEPSARPLTYFHETVDFAAMVPMQVFEQLKDTDSLNRVRKLLIGGGAVSAQLQANLQNSTCAAYESYGMTETVSHIALRAVNGADAQEGFVPMPNTSVSLDERGCLQISSPDLLSEVLVTNDCVEMLRNGQFIIRGRVDNVINSGGVKIQPEEIERKIASFFTKLFAVSSISDEKLGEKLVLLAEETISPEQLQTINQTLPAYHKLHQFFQLDSLPLTANGKLDRRAITLHI